MEISSAWLVDKTDMGGDDPPAFRAADPGLHLPPDLAGDAGAVEQRRGGRVVAAVGADDCLRQRAREPDRRTRGAERRDLRVAVEILGAAVADGARVLAEYLVQRGNVVRHQSLLV